jgi:hypothetical protein
MEANRIPRSGSQGNNHLFVPSFMCRRHTLGFMNHAMKAYSMKAKTHAGKYRDQSVKKLHYTSQRTALFLVQPHTTALQNQLRT